MGDQRRVHRRVRRGAGDTRAAVYLLGVSRDGHGRAARRMDDRTFRPGSDLPAVVPPIDRRAALLGPAEVQSELSGSADRVNAAVVGLLAAALYDPVWTTAIQAPADLALGIAAFGLLAFWKWPPWLVVPLAALAGGLISIVL